MRASNIVWVLLPTVVLSDWLSGGLLSILITADGGGKGLQGSLSRGCSNLVRLPCVPQGRSV